MGKEKDAKVDEIIIGAPTYFSDDPSEVNALIDRAGFGTMANGSLFFRKSGGTIGAVKREVIQAFDTINHLFDISSIFTLGSSNWNIGIGLHPGEVE